MNYVTPIFSFLIAIFCFWISIKMLRLYFKVRGWDRVTATILSKELFIHPKYSTSRSPYGLKVEYSYQVNNSDYKGTKIYLAELAGGQINHMKTVAQNKLNKIKPTMSIFVNPNNPQESVMYCEGVVLYSFVFFMAFVSLLIGISFL